MKKTLAIFFVILNMVWPSWSIQAAEFAPNYIISDAEYADFNSLGPVDIQQFLVNKNSSLAYLKIPDINGVERSAADIIFGAAQTYQINPKLLLVMLQKEQSLIEDSAPEQKQYDWAMGYGVCDDCSMNDPALMVFKGFGAQIDRAAARFRWYQDNPSAFKQAGRTYNIDGTNVTFSNQATANLFSYTPHLHGNYNFWKIWQGWFKQYYPDGSLLQAKGEAGVWLVEYGIKRPFLNRSALVSRFDPSNIVIVDKPELEKYETGDPIEFPNYSLLHQPDGKIFLLVDDSLRWIENEETFRMLGYNPEELIDVTPEDLSSYKQGQNLTIQSVFPLGTLLQNKTNGAVYYVESNVKHPIIDRDILMINYPYQPITQVPAEELNKYADGEAVKIKNNELVKTAFNPIVYLTVNDEKQPIKDEATFLGLGYKWDRIKVVSEKALSNLDIGETIDLKFKN
jgi:hypothetical protein